MEIQLNRIPGRRLGQCQGDREVEESERRGEFKEIKKARAAEEVRGSESERERAPALTEGREVNRERMTWGWKGGRS